jgi:hypothetical protein
MTQGAEYKDNILMNLANLFYSYCCAHLSLYVPSEQRTEIVNYKLCETVSPFLRRTASNIDSHYWNNLKI